MNLAVRGLRVLVAEDEYLIARQEAELLAEAGCIVVGPVSTVKKAIQLLGRQRIDAALLDIHLAGEEVFPLTDFLTQRSIPFAFVTGYSAGMVPCQLSGQPMTRKPFTRESLLGVLQAAMLPNRFLAPEATTPDRGVS